MTTSVRDAEELYQFAEKRGRYLIAAQSYRFKAEMQAAHRIVSNGILGDIYYAEAASFRRRGIPKWGLFHVADESAGGSLFDLGVHILDALNWIMGNPNSVSATGAIYKKFGNKDEGWSQHWRTAARPLVCLMPDRFRPKSSRSRTWVSDSCVTKMG